MGIDDVWVGEQSEGNLPRRVFQLTPLPDITAYELARLIVIINSGPVDYENLAPEIKRHVVELEEVNGKWAPKCSAVTQESKIEVKGVEFGVNVLECGEQDWRALILDCPGVRVGRGVTASAALEQAKAHLISVIKPDDRSPHQLRVEKMMRMISDLTGRRQPGQWIPSDPVGDLPEEGRKLRAKLILEEALETIHALGFRVVGDGELRSHGLGFNLIGTIDGCFDLRVVTTGTLSAFGIPDESGQRLVDENNLAKFGPGCTVRSDGKLIKPPDHKAPDLEGWLKGLGIGANNGEQQELDAVSGEQGNNRGTGQNVA